MSCDFPPHYWTALQKLGIKELKGREHNPLIVDMFRLVTGKAFPDEVSWCAAFVGACLEENGLRSSGRLAARSYLSFGYHVETPRIGDIVVLWRESRSSWKGHVGFYAGETSLFIKVLGGNQSDQVSIAHYPKTRLLGYRRVIYAAQAEVPYAPV